MVHLRILGTLLSKDTDFLPYHLRSPLFYWLLMPESDAFSSTGSKFTGPLPSFSERMSTFGRH